MHAGAQEEALVERAKVTMVEVIHDRGPLRPAILVRAAEQRHKAYAVRYAYWELRADLTLVQDPEGLIHLGL